MASILLAEDDPSMRSFLKLALEKAGHTVKTEATGLKALAALRSENVNFDLLLTDIVMPGMDGIELAQKATRLHPSLKVMFITGFSAVALDDKRIRASDTTKILSKPFHLNDLVEQVNSLLTT